FSDGGTSIGQASLSTSAGVTAASFSTSSLTVGNHTITASYGGDRNFTRSTSAALLQTVNKAATSLTVNTSANPSAYGQNVTFSASARVTPPGAATPTGTYQFQIHGNAVRSP